MVQSFTQNKDLRYCNFFCISVKNFNFKGVRRKYPHCRLIRRKIILNKKTTTTISTLVDAKPKTNASKLLSVNLRVSCSIFISNDIIDILILSIKQIGTAATNASYK